MIIVLPDNSNYFLFNNNNNNENDDDDDDNDDTRNFIDFFFHWKRLRQQSIIQLDNARCFQPEERWDLEPGLSL